MDSVKIDGKEKLGRAWCVGGSPVHRSSGGAMCGSLLGEQS
jgi:hypothetical protein